MKISKKLSSRMKAYSAMGATMIGADATAAIVYTDVSPDFTGGSTSSYFLDLNNDAVNDFEIFSNTSSYYTRLFLSPLAAGNMALGSVSGNYAYPYVLSNGNNIGAAATGSWLSNSIQSLNYMGNFGNWMNVTDKYLGLQITVGSNIYYGWCRMDVNSDGSAWVVKDYAFENTPNTAIAAGDVGTATVVQAGGALNITVADVGNSNNGSDLEVSFDKAADETTVGDYRVMVVKSANAASFDTAAAKAVAAADYLSVTPNATATYTQIFPVGGTDVDGDAIADNQPYKIFVLSVADGTIASADSLVGPSAEITLINDIGLYEFGKEKAALFGFDKTIVADIETYPGNSAGITITDISGKPVYNQKLEPGMRHEISMGEFPAGIYTAILSLENETISEKIMIH